MQNSNFSDRAALREPYRAAQSERYCPTLPLILLIGLPGSGKTTIAQHIQTLNSGYLVISTDRIRAELFGDEAIQGAWPLIERSLHQKMQQAIRQIQQQQAIAVLYDATNAVRRDRRRFLQQARSIGFNHLTGLWIDTPLDLCLQRNQQRSRQVPEPVILRMHRRLMGAPPSLAEGLDCLIRYPTIEALPCDRAIAPS
ncbi:AAA family ATPase [Microcoleus sp. FACHB-1515]|nr:AAA family ATPase [Microcoleus sp. FACHB-1515]